MFNGTYSAVWQAQRCYITFVDQQLSWYQAATRSVLVFHCTFFLCYLLFSVKQINWIGLEKLGALDCEQSVATLDLSQWQHWTTSVLLPLTEFVYVTK